MQTLELKVPPVAVFLVIAVAMWAAGIAADFADVAILARTPVSVAMLFAGGALGVSGIVSFRRNGTTVHPMQPSEASVIVTDGIYRLTRNPMYLGLAFVLAGWAVWLQNLVASALLPVFLIYITRFQILPEERAMSALFGEDYTAYRKRVRRWI